MYLFKCLSPPVAEDDEQVADVDLAKIPWKSPEKNLAILS
jgi:hypothetical protein